MHADQSEPDPHTQRTPPKTPRVDPEGMKDAHARTGRLLKHAGLPFEDDEFDEDAGAREHPGSNDER